MPKKSLAELLDAGMNESLQSAPEAEPSVDGPLEPPTPQESEAGAQATPFRARPTHPYWRGEDTTESALRAVHLWPRAKPAPAAVAAAARRWSGVLAASRKAHTQGTAREAVQVLVTHLAAAYRELGAGGAPPIEMLRDETWPDLKPTDGDRVRFDTAVLVIVKIETAMAKAYQRGGAWREAVDQASVPA